MWPPAFDGDQVTLADQAHAAEVEAYERRKNMRVPGPAARVSVGICVFHTT